MPKDLRGVEGMIGDIDQTAVHDGPGVRMNVYLKGCKLRCSWCHSPELQSFKAEIVWYETRCARCGKCVEICPEGIRTFDLMDGEDRARCRLCGECLAVCAAGALEIKGRRVRAGEIADEAVRLMPFFRRTGGGITITGGDPLGQPEFSFAVAALCGESDIHVAMETSGSVPWPVLSRLVPVVDLFLYDVKLPGERLHKIHTGFSNRQILNNLKGLVEAGADVIVRVPLIPGVNDDVETISAIGQRVLKCGAKKITLLPFNPATPGKYSWVRKKLILENRTCQSGEETALLERALEKKGLVVVPV